MPPHFPYFSPQTQGKTVDFWKLVLTYFIDGGRELWTQECAWVGWYVAEGWEQQCTDCTEKGVLLLEGDPNPGEGLWCHCLNFPFPYQAI